MQGTTPKSLSNGGFKKGHRQMGTTRYWFGLTNEVWTSLEVVDVTWNTYDYEDPPKKFKGWKIAKGETKKDYLEVYNGANGAGFTLTIKVENDRTFTVNTDPREQVTSKISNHSLIAVANPDPGLANWDPPVIYANLQPSWGEHSGVEYVVTNQADGLLANDGDLDHSRYEAWTSLMKKNYYSHKFFKGTIPVAESPPDDREDGAFTERYSTLRNANLLFARFLADTITWEADLVGVFSNFFKTLPTPLYANPSLYQDDGWFTRFLLQGPDPTTLELVTDRASLPPVLFERSGRGRQNPELFTVDYETALHEGRLFHVDFSRFAEVESAGRFASWPHAVFMSTPSQDSFGRLVYNLAPVMIALVPPGQNGKRMATVYPRDNDESALGCTWETAKRVFLSAAANYHELGTHLGRCHLVMERYALATYRYLPKWHPVGRLLRPHFKFMVATNNDAFNNLINAGGPVDKSFMATVDQLTKISVDAFNSWSLEVHGGIATDLGRRGLLKAETKLPFWPYKEYGLAIYRAIQVYVTSYLRLWYAPDGAKYRADSALQNWRRALRDEYRAGSLMEASAPFEDLVTACTNMIWTSGPQHSAVNYTQYDFLADAYTLPFGIQQTPGAKPFEPTRGQIGDQAEVIARLSLFRYDRLGSYSTASFLTEYGDLGAPRQPWTLVIDRFQNELARLGAAQSDGQGVWSYPFLHPANITNGISI
jgi:arachidonate 15-lipoxygenase